MNEKKLSDKTKYNMQLRKKLEKKQFNTDLNKNDFEELEKILKEKEISKALFIRVAKNNLEKGMLKMKKCEEIKDYLKGKEIELNYGESEDFDLGNHPAQSEEDTIVLEDGYLFYIINREETKCYISISRRTDPNDIDDKHLDDGYLDGYFDVRTLLKLLKLL